MVDTAVYPNENYNGCKTFDTFKIEFKLKPGGVPNVVLVNHGDCYFALKVWNTQNVGATVVLVSDDREELFISMDSPEEDSSATKYLQNITIPSPLIENEFAHKLKAAINKGDMVNINLEWRESVPHPNDRVEYELGTGVCKFFLKELPKFLRKVVRHNSLLIISPGAVPSISSKQCKAQCINHGRRCVLDLLQGFS